LLLIYLRFPFPEPLGPRIVEFHRLFYHRVPTDAQAATLLKSAGFPL
jgi:hypothetical protein